MLERLQIRNFQRHKRLAIDFDPRTTTITGVTDSGKSSTMRAIKWACMNQPQGDAHIRIGAKGCSVRMRADGKTVVRKRGGSINTYMIDDQEYKAFGTGVPDPVADLLNVGPANFQGQHDAPFWFSDTAGQVSRNLNAVVNLDVIDDSLAAAAKGVAKARLAAELAEERHGEAETAAEGLEWVPDAKRRLGEVEAAKARHSGVAARASAVGGLVAEGVEYTEAGRIASGAASGALRAVAAGRAVVKVGRRRASLEDLVGRIVELEKVEAPDTEKIDAAAVEYKRAAKRRSDVSAMVGDVRRLSRELDKRGEAEAIVAKLRKGRCPLCGAALDQTKRRMK